MKSPYFYLILLTLFIAIMIHLNPLSVVSALEKTDELTTEESLKSLLYYAVIILPIGVALSTAVIVHTLDAVAASNRQSVMKLFSLKKPHTLGEWFSNAFSSFFFWIILLVGLLMMVLRVFTLQVSNTSELQALLLLLFALPLAFLFPLAVAFIFIRILPTQLSFSSLGSAFLWGSFAAVITMTIAGMYYTFFDSQNLSLNTLIIAPVIEEGLKMVAVLILFLGPRFRNPVDGLLIALLAGFGFSAFENFVYFMTKNLPFQYGAFHWISLIFYRSFFNTLAHGFFTGLIGISLGYSKQVKRDFGYALVNGYLFAMIAHSLFNFSAIIDVILVNNIESPIVIFNPLLVILLGITLIILLIHLMGDTINEYRSLREIRRFIKF